MPNRGSLVVILLLVAGLGASTVALWHHRQKTRQALELWGTAGSLLVERAPKVTLFRLRPIDSPAVGEQPLRVRIFARTYRLTAAHDMQGAAGFSHVRWGLCQDSSYAWQKSCDECEQPSWDYAIRFDDGKRQITIAIDTKCATLTELGSERCVSFEPIAAEMAKVLGRQLPLEES